MHCHPRRGHVCFIIPNDIAQVRVILPCDSRNYCPLLSQYTIFAMKTHGSNIMRHYQTFVYCSDTAVSFIGVIWPCNKCEQTKNNSKNMKCMILKINKVKFIWKKIFCKTKYFSYRPTQPFFSWVAGGPTNNILSPA